MIKEIYERINTTDVINAFGLDPSADKRSIEKFIKNVFAEEINDDQK